MPCIAGADGIGLSSDLLLLESLVTSRSVYVYINTVLDQLFKYQILILEHIRLYILSVIRK